MLTMLACLLACLLSIDFSFIQTSYRLKYQEAELKILTEQQGTNVQTFVALVQDNQQVLQQQKAILQADTLQRLAQSILNSDVDASGTFSEHELQRLQLNLMTFPDVQVNVSALRDYMKGSVRTLDSVLNLVAHMDEHDIFEAKK